MDDDPAEVEQIKTRKRALRGAALAARRQLTASQRAAASAEVIERLSRLREIRDAHTVLVYAAKPDEEVDLAGLIGMLRRGGTRTLFPRVRGDDMELVATADLRTLQLGYRGILEPNGPTIDPEQVDVAVVPGVAFDPHGRRLGRGGGHYDRLLASLPSDAPSIGVCFACQVVPTVPIEDHDQVVDVVVSERATYRVTSRHGGTPA